MARVRQYLYIQEEWLINIFWNIHKLIYYGNVTNYDDSTICCVTLLCNDISSTNVLFFFHKIPAVQVVGYQSCPHVSCTSSVCPKIPIEDVYRYISIYMKKDVYVTCTVCLNIIYIIYYNHMWLMGHNHSNVSKIDRRVLGRSIWNHSYIIHMFAATW